MRIFVPDVLALKKIIVNIWCNYDIKNNVFFEYEPAFCSRYAHP